MILELKADKGIVRNTTMQWTQAAVFVRYFVHKLFVFLLITQ